MRTAALASLALLLAGCATAPTLDAPSALNGHGLDTAFNLYGRWDQRVVLNGRPHYVWRRAVVMNGKSYYCELRAQLGFRDVIASSVVEGYPTACSLFNVQYTGGYDVRRDRDPAAMTHVARNWRPVGTAPSAEASGQDASARPRSAAAGPGGSE
jgi:hypothetical protein